MLYYLRQDCTKSTTLYHLRQRTNLWCKLELAAANPTSEKLHLLLLQSRCIPSKSKSGTSSLQQLPSKSKPRIAFLKIGFQQAILRLAILGYTFANCKQECTNIICGKLLENNLWPAKVGALGSPLSYIKISFQA